MKRRLVALAASLAWCGATALGGPAAAGAAPAARPGGLTVHPSGGATSPITSAGRDGATTVVWSTGSEAPTRIWAATRKAGGQFGQPELAAEAAPGSTGEPQELVVAADGTAYLLWSSTSGDDHRPDALRLVSRPPGGRWRPEREVAAAPAGSTLGARGTMVELADGTLLIAWSVLAPLTAEGPKVFSQVPADGIAAAVERRPDGGWTDTAVLGPASSATSTVRLGANPAGGAVAVWERPGQSVGDALFGGSPLEWAERGVDGTWQKAPTDRWLRAGAYGDLGPLVDASGAFHVLELWDGPYGIGDIGHRLVGRALPPGKGDTMRRASKKQTRNGWFGGGWYIHDVDALLDARGQLVVAWGNEPPDVEQGGFGLGALWAATRAADGGWSVAAIDALADTTGAMNLDLSHDATGAVVATWAVDSHGLQGAECQSVVYQSRRWANGHWSRRVAVAVLPEGQPEPDLDLRQSSCASVAPTSTGGSSPVLSWTDGAGTLGVEPVAAVSSAKGRPAISVRQRSRTWRDVRRSGGLQLSCRARGGFCSISTVRATSAARGNKRRVLNCFRLRHTQALRSTGSTVVTLPWADRCSRGWVPPTESFRLLVTVDQLGREAASRWVTVRIRR